MQRRSHCPVKINQQVLCLVSDFGLLSKQVDSRGHIFTVFCRITQTANNSSGALCFVARVRGGGIFHNHMRKRGSPVQRWEGYTGRVSLYTPRGNTDVHASHLCAHAHTQMKFGVGEGKQEVVQEVIMVLKNTALVSTALTNLCWDIPNFLPEQKSTHKHTTVCIYADEHT